MTADEFDYQEALRRLALNDERFVASMLSFHRGTGTTIGPGVTEEALRRAMASLDGRTRNLVDLAAFIAVGSGEASIDSAVENALQAGATVEDVIAVLVSIAPAVGSARIVDCAPVLAAAVGYDMWADLEGFGEPPTAEAEASAAKAHR